MDATLLYMSSEEIAQSIQSAQLELAYERALQQADRIYEEERVRAMRVQLLLAEYESDEFQEQAERDEDEQHNLEELNEELRTHLSEVEADLQQTQMELKARLRDLERLKTEVNALNAASADATRILSEKLALARELNTLKPELEHLKSQASSHQKLLAEKLALQRELSSLQVELETEKRTVQRIKAQEKTSAEEDSVLTAEIDALKKELAKAHRDTQKSERENRKRAMEWEGEKEILEGKLDAFRNKLRSTKDQLKEAQDDIEKLQSEKMAQSAEMTKARLTGTSNANSKKRNVARFDPDMTIGTPGNGAPAAKKQRMSVNVGDKSNFSITPFLNRTLSILPESPSDEQNEEVKKPSQIAAVNEAKQVAFKSKTVQSRPEKPSTTKKVSASTSKPKTGALKETTNSRANSTIKKPQLAKLVEELSDLESEADEAEANSNVDKDKENTVHTETTQETNQDAPEPFTKAKVSKRANIFDEEDEASLTKVRDLGRGGGGILGRINLKAKPIGKGKALAEFSPLKRDRRAASVV
ncbi:hypothetical protein PV11_05515 [Exophiala sideris]|uniref:Uncharacterized protein n=1 Tax=Exophiala sideris TaxID=1016849 RepID=A0A0D1YQB7_9EURO|nr:hypothetical protein PV11_05515 [Exophiala sideris]